MSTTPAVASTVLVDHAGRWLPATVLAILPTEAGRAERANLRVTLAVPATPTRPARSSRLFITARTADLKEMP